MRATVVLDPHYGALTTQQLGDAFWLIDSAENRTLAQTLWAAGGTNANSAVFKVQAGVPPEDAVLSTFEDVDLHHPEWTEIEFVGLELTAKINQRFLGEGFTVASGGASLSVRRRP